MESPCSLVDGWLDFAKQVSSENCDERPEKTPVDLLVIHNISLPPEKFGGNFVKQLFTNQLDFSVHPYFEQLRDLRVSAHFFIDRNGRLTQFVPLHKRAWHAGQSNFCGRERCNDFSIGVELEGSDNQPFCHDQYVTLANLFHKLILFFPALANSDNIVGHSEIAPGRKTDPGPYFDWDVFFSLAGITR